MKSITGLPPINTAEEYLLALLRLDELHGGRTAADKAELAALDKAILDFEAAALDRGLLSVL